MSGMSEEFDLFVIGAGMAGTTAANRCAAEGWRVGIVDALPYGARVRCAGAIRRRSSAGARKCSMPHN